MMMTDAQLLELIDRFLSKHKVRPTRFGIEALGDGGLIKGLRAGRSLSLKNAEKVVKYMEGYRAAAARKVAA